MHLFFKIIERKNSLPVGKDGDYSLFMDVGEGEEKISEIIHSWINYEEGDSYAWSVKNIEKEEIDKLWNMGQRAFVLNFGYKETILYDITLITHEEYRKYLEIERKGKELFVDNIFNVCKEYDTSDLDDLPYLRKDLKKALKQEQHV